MIKVSVISLAYNQEKYIKSALDGFVSQQTTFDFEVIIHDDASTDETVEIIKKYQKKHPNIIKLVTEKENQYSKGNFDFIKDMMLSAKGEYIAFCEGDDYWTDPNKLQLQVDFLEANKDHALCFHPAKVIHEKNEIDEFVFPDPNNENKFDITSLLKGNFIQTNSVMFRRVDYEKLRLDVMPGDWYMDLYHAQYGKIGFINQVMSVYRRHNEGIWWDSDKKTEKVIQQHGLMQMTLFKELLRIYGTNPKHRTIILQHIRHLFEKLIEVDKSSDNSLLATAIEASPELTASFIHEQQRIIKGLEGDLEFSQKETRDLKERNQQEIHELEKELKLIKASKVWKLRNKLKG